MIGKRKSQAYSTRNDFNEKSNGAAFDKRQWTKEGKKLRLRPARSERTRCFAKRDRWNKMLDARNAISSRRSSKSRVVSSIFRFSLPFQALFLANFSTLGRGRGKLMFRLLDTLPRFFYSSSYRVNLSTGGCCWRRIIANSFYSAGGCTINSATRSAITQPKLRNNKSTWALPREDRSSTSVDITRCVIGRGRSGADELRVSRSRKFYHSIPGKARRPPISILDPYSKAYLHQPDQFSSDSAHVSWPAGITWASLEKYCNAQFRTFFKNFDYMNYDTDINFCFPFHSIFVCHFLIQEF